MRIFVNMNTILFESPTVKWEESIYDVGYYKNWKPRQQFCSLFGQMAKDNIDLYIYSSCISKNIENIKKNLIKEYYPFISQKNIIFTFNKKNSSSNDILFEQDDIYIDIKEIDLVNIGTLPAHVIQLDKSQLSLPADELKKLLIPQIQDSLISFKNVKILNNDFVYYQIFNFETQNKACGYIQGTVNDIKVSKNDLLKKEKKEKMDITQFSYLFNALIDEMIRDFSKSTVYIFNEATIKSLLKKQSALYSNINKEIIIKCFTHDINSLMKKTNLIKKDSENYIISPNIILLFDFSRKEEFLKKIEKLKIEYFLIKSEKIQQEIEQLLFFRELSVQAKLDFLNKREE